MKQAPGNRGFFLSLSFLYLNSLQNFLNMKNMHFKISGLVNNEYKEITYIGNDLCEGIERFYAGFKTANRVEVELLVKSPIPLFGMAAKWVTLGYMERGLFDKLR